MTENKEQACPALAGELTGYLPEYKNQDGIWKAIPLNNNCPLGLIRARHLPEVLALAGLYGYATAMALAWGFKAINHFGTDEVRVVPYRVRHSMEAFRKELDAELVGQLSIIKDLSKTE